MTPEKIEVQVPDEPPHGSIAIDKDGRAWQRIGNPHGIGDGNWAAAQHVNFAAQPGSSSWLYLIAALGPVTLVHRGEPKS